jgi:RNA polymerase sigma-70 factor (ECF subfamily)
VEDAEDAVQEALVRAWRALPRFEGCGSLRGWLYRIATNASVDAARARGRTVPIAAKEPDFRERVDADHEQREALRVTLAMVRELLPGRQATVLVARARLGFSARDTADLLGMSEAAVNSAVQRARTRLRRRRRALA